MARTLFIDVTCPKPYGPQALASEGMGGTEATVVRIAERLGLEHSVTVRQHNRACTELGNAIYEPIEQAPGLSLDERWDVVVMLREPRLIGAIKAQSRDARLLVWMHDLVGRETIDSAQTLADSGAILLAVSEFHKTQVQEALRIGCPTKMPRVLHVYNPISDELQPNGTPYDSNKLVFFSSPHKGLDYTLDVFQCARNFNPDFKLYIANPGYMPSASGSAENVVNLGILPHSEMMGHLREALCVFHLNTVFPETQGIVYGEAQAVGTPFMGHNMCGAIGESSDHPSQLLDVRDRVKVIDRLMAWHSGNRPTVRLRPEMRMSAVAARWNKILKGDL